MDVSFFIDYEKAYVNVNRDKLWEMMDNKIPNYLLNTIKCKSDVWLTVHRNSVWIRKTN